MGVNDWADKGGQPGQFTNLTPDDIMGFTQWMAQDKELAGISVEAQAKVFGQFGPKIQAGGYDLERHKRLSIQAQMGADPYGATMNTGAMMGIGQLDFEKLHGLMEAVSNMGPIEQKTLEATSEMFKSLHGPIALAQGGEEMFKVATRQVKDMEATKKAAEQALLGGEMPSPAPIMRDQEYVQVNQELIDTLNNPARNEVYQAALSDWHSRMAWGDPTAPGEAPRLEDFNDITGYDETYQARRRQVTRKKRFTGIAEGMRWARDPDLLRAETGVQAQGAINQIAQQWALAPVTMQSQIEQNRMQMGMAKGLAPSRGAAQLANLQAGLPYQQGLQFEQARTGTAFGTMMSGIQSQYGFTGNWETAQVNVKEMAKMGLSPNAFRQLAGIPGGDTMAKAFEHQAYLRGEQRPFTGAYSAIFQAQGRGPAGLPYRQQEMWDIQDQTRQWGYDRQDAMQATSQRGLALNQERHAFSWGAPGTVGEGMRWDQFNLQREQQEYNFGYRRQQLLRGRDQQALSGRGMDLQQRGLDLGMAQFGERFGMQTAWAQTQFENQMADLQRQRDQSMQMRVFAQADMPLQRRKFEMGQVEAQQRIQFREQDVPRQRGYQLADVSFQQAQTARQFGWQMEDMDENIRFSTGRGRRRLLRQRGRLVESRNIQTGREDEMEDRRETEWEIEDERFKIVKDRTEEIIKIDAEMYDRREEKIRTQWAFEDENFEIQRERMLEAREHQIEMMDMQKRHFEEQHALQVSQFELQKERHELQQKNMDAQLAHLNAQEAFALRAHEQAELRMTKEQEFAVAQLKIQEDQLAAQIMFKDELRAAAKAMKEMQRERIELDAMMNAQRMGMGPEEWEKRRERGEGWGPDQFMDFWKDTFDPEASNNFGTEGLEGLKNAINAITEMNELISGTEGAEGMFARMQKDFVNLGTTGVESIQSIISIITGTGKDPAGYGGTSQSALLSGQATLSGSSAGAEGGGAESLVGAAETFKEAVAQMSGAAVEAIIGEEDSLMAGWQQFFGAVGMGEKGKGLLGTYTTQWVQFFAGGGDVEKGILSQMQLLMNEEHLGALAPLMLEIKDGTDNVTKSVGLFEKAAESAVETLVELIGNLKTAGGGVIPDDQPLGMSDDVWEGLQEFYGVDQGASGFHGLVNRGDYLVRGGRKMSVAEHGSEWLDVWPNEASGRQGGGGDVAAALNGMKVELIVDGNQMDGYLRTRERTNLYRESFR